MFTDNTFAGDDLTGSSETRTVGAQPVLNTCNPKQLHALDLSLVQFSSRAVNKPKTTNDAIHNFHPHNTMQMWY